MFFSASDKILRLEKGQPGRFSSLIEEFVTDHADSEPASQHSASFVKRNRSDSGLDLMGQETVLASPGAGLPAGLLELGDPEGLAQFLLLFDVRQCGLQVRQSAFSFYLGYEEGPVWQVDWHYENGAG